MDLVYRVLGLAAAVGTATSRISINLIRINWVLMVGLGCGLVVAGNEVRFALANDAAPRALAVADVMRHADVDRNFVTVQGELVPGAVFTHTTTRNRTKTTDASYYALLDEQHEHAVLVRTPGSSLPGRDTGKVALTGMLMPIDSDLQAELARTSGRIEDVRFDTEYVLEWGRHPGDLGVWSALTAVLAIALLAMLTTWRNRYVVFRASGALPDPDGAAAPLPVDEPLPVRVSGIFQLAQHTRRFTNMRAVLADAEGTPVVCANVDASSSFMGVKTADRVGIWTIPLPQRELQSIDVGYQYLGFRRLPALRVRHRGSKREVTTVLNCDDGGSLRVLADRLTAPSAPPTA